MTPGAADTPVKGSRRFGMSLSLRIWLVFAAVNMVTVVATLATTWYVSRLSVEERAQEQVTQQIANVERDYRSSIVEQLQYHLDLLAGLPTVDDMLRATGSERSLLLDRMYRQFALITDDLAGYGSVVYVLDDGQVGLHLENGKRIRTPRNLEDPREELPNESLRAMADLFAELKKRPLLLSAGNMEWFMPPRPMVSSGIIRNERGEPSLMVALAKLDVDVGVFGGAVMIRYDLQKFVDRMASIRVLGAGGVWLFDNNDMALLKPDDFRDGPLPMDLLASTKAREKTTVALPGGIVGLGALVAARHAPPMRMAVTVPSSAFSSELDPLFLLFAATVAISALVFGVVAIAASRGLTRPISALREAASRLANGDFTVRSTSRSSGEIGQLEESFDQMAENLQSAIRSRENSLEKLREQTREQERLIRARIEAESAAKASSELLAHMSHELRTPLNSIIGFTDVMGQKMFGPLGHAKYEEYVNDVSYSANHLLGLISDILDLSKIEAGQMEAEFEPFDVAELLEECAMIVRPAARTDIAAIGIAAIDGLPHLNGDRRMLRQIVINLLSNAAKFTPKDGSIDMAVTMTPGSGMEISVTDTGCGIPADKLEHVLEPFGQARETSNTSHHTGTGLGLSLSKRLTEFNEGELKIESTVGVGTIVRLTFPVERLSQASQPEAPLRRTA